MKDFTCMYCAMWPLDREYHIQPPKMNEEVLGFIEEAKNTIPRVLDLWKDNWKSKTELITHKSSILCKTLTWELISTPIKSWESITQMWIFTACFDFFPLLTDLELSQSMAFEILPT
jgi:hypothetical protein